MRERTCNPGRLTRTSIFMNRLRDPPRRVTVIAEQVIAAVIENDSGKSSCQVAGIHDGYATGLVGERNQALLREEQLAQLAAERAVIERG